MTTLREKYGYATDGKILVEVHENMIGQKYGTLTIKERSVDYVQPSSGKRSTRYTVKCDCGCETFASAYALVAGVKKYCGRSCEFYPGNTPKVPATKKQTIKRAVEAAKANPSFWPAPRAL